MSLRNRLPEHVIADVAILLHQQVCCEHEEVEFDSNDDEQAECVIQDLEVVKDILDLLDANGVGIVRATDIPFRIGDSGAFTT